MSDDDEYDYDPENNQEYECQNKGCRGLEIFRHNTEEWFAERSAPSPKNCRPCRRWIDSEKEIGPVVASCHYCRYTRPIEATYRIMYHRNMGSWDDYWEENKELQMCRRCAEFPSRRRLLARVAAERKYRDPAQRQSERDKQIAEEQDQAFLLAQALGRNAGTDPKGYHVPSAALFYDGIDTPPAKVWKFGLTQLTHIMREKHEWGRKFGTNDPDTILQITNQIAISTKSHVREYATSTGVVKYDTRQRIAVHILEDRSSPTQYRIETSFPTDNAYVFKKIKAGHWK